MTPDTPTRLRWRTRSNEQGQSSQVYPLAEAVRAMATLNGSQAGWCHWWYVRADEPAVTIEPETNVELRQVTE